MLQPKHQILTTQEVNQWLNSFRLVDGLKNWAFQSGMQFGSEDQWWNGKKRPEHHNGIDLAEYCNLQSELVKVNASVAVPVFQTGEVVRCFGQGGRGGDLIAESVVVKHSQFGHGKDGSTLHSVYGHMNRDEHINTGTKLRGSEVIGKIACPQNILIPAHLHFSLFWISNLLVPANLNWETLANSDLCVPIDPLKF